MRIVLALLVLVAACGGGDAAGPAEGELVGLFRLTPGAAEGETITGTWFRMLQPGGDLDGPYMINADSPADGGEVTLLEPGTSGGFRSGGYQSQPDPAFDAEGDSLAAAITRPTRFFGVEFGISTNPVDPQARTEVGPPTVVVQPDGTLTADLSSWAASWNHQDFNQGAPKPVPDTGADAPGQARAEAVWDFVSETWLEAAPAPRLSGEAARGTFDPATGAFTLEWTSLIEGGPFNGFTGRWHLEGTFEPDP